MPSFRISANHRDVTATGNQLQIGKTNVSYTATGEHEDRRVITVGTSEVPFVFSTDIVNAGICYLENINATNFVSVGFTTGVYGIRLLPGVPQQIVLEPALASLFLLADTASCNVLVHVREA